MPKNNCAFCNAKLKVSVLNLRKQPIANRLLKSNKQKYLKHLKRMEKLFFQKNTLQDSKNYYY